MHKYANFGIIIPYGSRVLSIFTNLPRPVGLMLSKASSFTNSCYAYQWLDNFDMHTYAKFDHTIYRCFKSYEHFYYLLLDGRTDSHCDYHKCKPAGRAI